MQRASIGKILLALVIACIYIYLFGIVQVVHVSADNDREIEVAIPEVTASAQTQKAPETTTIKLQSDKKPTLGDRKAQTTAATTAQTTTTTIKKRVPAPAATSIDNTVVVPETTTIAETPAPETKAPETTTTAPETQSVVPVPETTVAPETTAAPQTTPAPETTAAEGPTPDNSGAEQFTVYDQVTGTYKTGSARDIIAGAVVGEIWNEFPDEAVKAQAVAEYTYIKKQNEMGLRPTVSLKTDIYDRIYKLVDEVLGEAIYYNGEMIQSVFYASSCGYTNSAENVWNVYYPYLVSVDCPLDKTTDPNWGSTDSYSSDYMKNAVQSTLGITLTGDPSTWFKINSTLDNREHGWVTSVSVGGMTKANGKTIDGRVIRETVLGYSLKSAAFELKYDAGSDKFIFTTYGHGHGVGMSQYGAKALAENGYSYKQILHSREALENALSNYGGTLLIVSHDRYLINKLADRIVWLDKNGTVNIDGNYDRYIELKAAKEQAEQTNLAVQAKAVTEAKKNDYKERKERESTLRKLNGALKRCEQAIEDVETKTAELAEQMSKPEIATDYEKASKLSEEIAVLKEKEEELTAQWMELSEQIETFS